MAAVVAAGLAIAAAALATWALAVVLAAEQVALAWAWGRALHSSPGTIALVAGWSVLADVVLLVSHRHAYGSAAGVAGAAVAAVVLYQLGLRRAVTLRAHETTATAEPSSVGATSSVSATSRVSATTRVSAELVTGLGGIILGVLSTGYLALRAGPDTPNPADLTVIAGLLGAGAAVVVSRLLGWAGLGEVPAGVLGVLAALGAGAGLGGFGTDGLTAAAGLAAAAAGAVVAGLVDLTLVRARPEDSTTVSGGPSGSAGARSSAGVLAGVATLPGVLLAAVLPLACAAPLVYLVGRHLPG